MLSSFIITVQDIMATIHWETEIQPGFQEELKKTDSFTGASLKYFCMIWSILMGFHIRIE